jgi:hypothetical protein
MTGDHDASTTPSAENRVRFITTPIAQRRARETLRRALSDWELDAWFTLSITSQVTRDELEAEANP